MAKKVVRKATKRKLKVNRGRIGNRVIVGIVAALVALPVAVGAVMQQTNVLNHASGGELGQPITDLNTSSDIKTTTNADGTMGPVTASANYANSLPANQKGTLAFSLYSEDPNNPYPSQAYTYPTQPYTYPTQAYPPQTYPSAYPQPTSGCPSPAQGYGYAAAGAPAANNKGKNDNKGNKGQHGPQDITALCLTISKVEVHIAYLGTPGKDISQPVDKWEVLGVTNPTTIDLFNVNAASMLGLTELAIGRYTEVRLYVSKATAKLANGQIVTLTVLGKNNIVKVNKTFTIEEGKTTNLSLVFDPSHSVIKAGDTYLLKPVVAKIQETH
jgi:hypothetical protein